MTSKIRTAHLPSNPCLPGLPCVFKLSKGAEGEPGVVVGSSTQFKNHHAGLSATSSKVTILNASIYLVLVIL